MARPTVPQNSASLVNPSGGTTSTGSSASRNVAGTLASCSGVRIAEATIGSASRNTARTAPSTVCSCSVAGIWALSLAAFHAVIR